MFELQTYLLLHTLTFFSTVFGILLSFKYYNAQNIYLMSSTLLHLFLCYTSLKAPSRINQTLFNRLIMNYSFHFILMNILFYFVGVPLSWGVAILLVSFYRLVEYLSTYMFRGATDGIGKTINDIYLKLTNPPLAYININMHGSYDIVYDTTPPSFWITRYQVLHLSIWVCIIQICNR